MTFFCRLFKDCLGSGEKSPQKTPPKIKANAYARVGAMFPIFVPLSMVDNSSEIQMAPVPKKMK